MHCPSGGRLLLVLGVLAVLPGCHRKETPPAPPVIVAPDHPLAPWAWHKLGGLLVVVGEVEGPTDLILKGRYLNENMHAEFGPVRWELYAPPPNEIAELRTKEGKLLARWEFDAPAPKPPEPPKVVKTPKPVKKTRTHQVVPTAAAVPVPAPPLPATPPPVSAVPLPIAVKAPWPETHLPLVRGPVLKPVRTVKASPVPAKTTPILPKLPAVPLPPVANVLPPTIPAPLAEAAQAPWPETHLPQVHGPAMKPLRAVQIVPAPVETLPALPKVAVPAMPSPLAKVLPPAKPAPVPTPPPLPAPEPLPRPGPSPTPVLPPTFSQEWPGAGEALNLIRGPRGSHWVCMTFDGGSTAEVALDVLDALKERGIHTTFFLTGEFIRKLGDGRSLWFLGNSLE